MAERSVNKVTLLGRLGKDAATSFTPSGIAKTTFSIATSYRFKKGEEWQEETCWHNVVLWRSENLANYLTKGKQIYVEGRIANRKYEKDGETKYISEVVADEVILCGGGKAGESEGGERASSAKAGTNAKQPSGDAMPWDDDIPF